MPCRRSVKKSNEPNLVMQFAKNFSKLFARFLLVLKYIFTLDSKKRVFLGLELMDRKFIEKKNEKINNLVVDYIVFENKNDFLEGQFRDGHLLINKRIFEYSKAYTDYIMLHEYGHKNTPKLFLLLHLGLLLFTALFVFLLPILFVFCVFSTILFFAFGGNSFDLFSLFIMFFLSSIFTLVFVLSQYIIEGYAEYFSIKHSSIKNYLEAHKELCQIRFENILKNKIKASFIEKCFMRYYTKLSYPDPKLVIWIYKKINKQK